MCPRASHEVGERLGQRRALAGRPGDRHRVDEAAGVGRDGGHPLVRRGGGHEGNEGDALPVARAADRVRLLEGQVGHDQAGDPVVGERRGEALGAGSQDDVGVTHEDDRAPGRELSRDVEHLGRGGPGLERARARRVDDGAVGQWIREGNPHLEQVGPGLLAGQADSLRRLQVREAPHQVGHESRALAVAGEGAGNPVRPGHRRPRRRPKSRAPAPPRGPCRRGPTGTRGRDPRPDSPESRPARGRVRAPG